MEGLIKEFEEYNKACDSANDLLARATLAGSNRSGSREFSVGSGHGSSEERSYMSGELSVHSHNSNESGQNLKTALALLGEKETIIYLIGLFEMKKRHGYQIGPLYEECRKIALNRLNNQIKFDENEQTISSIKELLKTRGFVYYCTNDRYNDPPDHDCTFYNAYLNMYFHPEKQINQYVDYVIEKENYSLNQFEIGNEITEHQGGYDTEDQHDIEHISEHGTQSVSEADFGIPQQMTEQPSSSHDSHYRDQQDSHHMQGWQGQDGMWSNQLNEPGNPSSSQGPWNEPFDSNEHYPSSHVHWPNPSGYDYYNQHNTSIQQNPSGQQIILDWMNNASSSTHNEPYGGPHNFHLVQSGQDQNTMLGYPLHHPWYPPFPHPLDLHQIQSNQSQNTMSGDHLNDPVNPPPSFQNPLDQQNPWDWNRFH
uniref:Uncharacterized protein n=1 Tax=Meloidogyne javanica TaxID=6303 RepID=A0A915LV50_MELJA